MPLAGRTAARGDPRARSQGERARRRAVLPAGRAGGLHAVRLPHAACVLPAHAGRSQHHSGWPDRTGRQRRADDRLPAGPVLGAGTDPATAHDLPIVEGDVPGGVFLGFATAHAGGFEGIGRARAGPRQSGRDRREGEGRSLGETPASGEINRARQAGNSGYEASAGKSSCSFCFGSFRDEDGGKLCIQLPGCVETGREAGGWRFGSPRI